MIYAIESDSLAVMVSSLGAQLQSLCSKPGGTQHLWQGTSPFWPGRAPILFPVVGQLKNNFYTYNGVAYTMPRHGFASLMEFDCINQAANQLIFELNSSAQTRQSYPFDFSLQAIYSIAGATLNVEYAVKNIGNHDMFFSIGGHEAYSCPGCFDDYYLEFGPGESDFISTTVKPGGLLMASGVAASIANNRLDLNYDIFDKHDTIIFENIKSKKVALRSKKSPSCIVIAFDAPHLGIWAQRGAPFVCIEPWHGLPDFENANGDIKNKEGILRLPAGESRSFCHSISIR